MQERIIELVIAGTRMENFRRELLGKKKGLTLQEALKVRLRWFGADLVEPLDLCHLSGDLQVLYVK